MINNHLKICFNIFVVFIFLIAVFTPIAFGFNIKKSIKIEEQLILSSDLMDSPWPMKSYDIRHTGRSPYSTEENLGIEKWRFLADDKVRGGAIVDNDGTIYFGDFDSNLYAVYPNGLLKWKSFLGWGWVWSTPAISEDGTIYVGTYGDYLHAINPDGTEKWLTDLGGGIVSSPAIAEDGTIYIGTLRDSEKGDIVAITPFGNIKWIYETGYLITCDPAIGDDGTIYCGSGDTFLYAINPDGTLKWKFDTGDYIKGHASIDDIGIVYIASFDDFLYALYPNDGGMKWKYNLDWGNSAGMAIGLDGTIYIGRGGLVALNPDGTYKWGTSFGNNRRVTKSSPAISADGTIFIPVEIGDADGGELIAFDSDGTELWRKWLGNYVGESSPCIDSNGAVYVGSASDVYIPGDPPTTEDVGYLHAFGLIDSNEKPNPPVVTSSSTGSILNEYYLHLSAEDPDLNPICFYVDWGDGTTSDWHGGGKPGYYFQDVASGQETFIMKEFSSIGRYTIKVKAKDSVGAESDWTEFQVKIKLNLNYIQSWLKGRFSQFPMSQKFLNI